MINLKVRMKNKAFWLGAIPAALLVVQTVATPFGYNWDFIVLNQQLANIVNAVFALLAFLGVAVDPTTEGLSDSVQAMMYDDPKPSHEPKHAKKEQA